MEPDHERIRAEIEGVRTWVAGVERRVAELAVELRERRRQTDDREAHTQKTIDRLIADVAAATRDLATIRQQISRFVGAGRALACIVSGIGGLIVAILTVITTHLLRG
jgi:predicted  nucleic acid-binding Zn-ribbon protein